MLLLLVAPRPGRANAPAADGVPRANDGFGALATDRSDVDNAGDLALRLDLGYLRSPLKLIVGGVVTRIVPNEVGLRAGLDVGLGHRLELGVWVPVTFDSYSAAGRALVPNAAGASTGYDVGAGDLRLFLKVNALKHRVVGLAFVAAAVLDSGDPNGFRSDGKWGADVRAIFDISWHWLSLAFNLGGRLHDTVAARDSTGAHLLDIGSELTWAAAFSAALHKKVSLVVELAGSESLSPAPGTSDGGRARTAEALVSLRLQPTRSLHLFVGVGRSLDADSARGDDIRFSFGLAWHPTGERAGRARYHDSDHDSDATIAEHVAPVETAPLAQEPPPAEQPAPLDHPAEPVVRDPHEHETLEVPAPVRFAHPAAELAAAGMQAVGRLVDFLGYHRELKRVRLEGHAAADERKPDDLSSERAQTVLRALAQRGVDPTRLQSVGYGAMRPAGKRAEENRRVECIIVDLPAGEAP